MKITRGIYAGRLFPLTEHFTFYYESFQTCKNTDVSLTLLQQLSVQNLSCSIIRTIH